MNGERAPELANTGTIEWLAQRGSQNQAAEAPVYTLGVNEPKTNDWSEIWSAYGAFEWVALAYLAFSSALSSIQVRNALIRGF